MSNKSLVKEVLLCGNLFTFILGSCFSISFKLLRSCCKINRSVLFIALLLLLQFHFCITQSRGQLVEGFEEPTTTATAGGTGMPTSYGTGTYQLSSGPWIFNNVIRGTSGIHSGAASCQLKSATGSSITTKNIATEGVASIAFYASLSTGAATSLQVGVSSNGGSSYTQITGSPFSLNTTPTSFSVPVNNTNPNLLVRFYRTSGYVLLDDINITYINPSTPCITSSVPLASVNTIYGSASATPTSFVVSGVAMKEGILVTPPNGFEVSLASATGYAAAITVGSAGTIANTTVYLRLKATAIAGNYSGNFVLSSLDAVNKNIASVASTIATYPLCISGLSVNNKVYDGSLNAMLTGTPLLSPTVNSDALNLSGIATATFATSIVEVGKIVAITGLVLTGTNSTSYSLTIPNSIAAISALSLTILNPVANNKIFDSTTFASMSGQLYGVITADFSNVILSDSGLFIQSSAGNNIVVNSTATISGTASGNYSLIKPIGLSASITQASQIINYVPFTTPVTTNNISFLMNANVASGLPVAFVSTNTNVATIIGSTVSIISIGTTTITASQDGDNNYLPATNISQTLTVNPAPIVIYKHGFESGGFGDTAYTIPPTILSNYLSNTKWSISNGVLQSFQGSGGAGSNSLSVNSGNYSSPYTLTMNVVNGYSLTVNSFSFWRYSSGIINWILYINGVNVGAGSSSNVGSDITTTNVSNPINGLTGVIKIQLVLSGSGSFRIDDFTINGNLLSCGVLPFIISQPENQTICSNSDITFNVSATGVNIYQWRKNNINIPGANAANYTINKCSIKDAGNYDIFLIGSSYCATTISEQVLIQINPVPSGIIASSSDSSVCVGKGASLYSTYAGFSESFETDSIIKFTASTTATAIRNSSYYQQGATSILLTAIANNITDASLAMSNDIDMTKYRSSPQLQFYHICALEGTSISYDLGYIEFSLNSGATWNIFPASYYLGAGSLVGASGGICFSTKSYTGWINNFTAISSTPGIGPSTTLWKKEIIDLSDFISFKNFRIRFRISTDVSGMYYGWLIDNLTIGSTPTSFIWTSQPIGFSSNIQNPAQTVAPLIATSYNVSAKNDYGCSTESIVTVSIKEIPSATISYINSPFCKNYPSQEASFSDIAGGPLTNLLFNSSSAISLNSVTGTIMPTGCSSGKYFVYSTYTGINGCNKTDSTLVEIVGTGKWKIQNQDSQWNNINNWTCSVLPSAIDDVVISTSSNQYPVLIDTESIHNLSVDSGARISVKSLLNIGGNIKNKGTINASIGKLIFNGSSTQSIAGGLTVNDIAVNNSAGVIIGNTAADTVFVSGIYTPISGTLTTNERLVLVSNANGTASVAAGSGNYISGKVFVQRYHYNKRSWVFLTAPLTTYGTNTLGDIKSNWQNYTYVSGPVISGGLDAGGNSNYSIYTWLGNSGWTPITNTAGKNTLFNGEGGDSADNKSYMIFLRGDRSVTPAQGIGASSAVIIQASGALQMGDKYINLPTVSGTKYGLIGNPYAAPIDLDKFAADNTSLFIPDALGTLTVYYWDTHTSGTGGYTTATYSTADGWNFAGDNYVTNPHPGFIQSGQAFFVSTNGQSTAHFKESHKDVTYSSNSVFGFKPKGRVKVNMSNGNTYIDGVLGLYNDIYSTALITPGEDAGKFWGNEEGLSILRSSKFLSIEARPEIIGDDTMFLYMNKMVVGTTYKFDIKGQDLPASVNGYLFDKYLNTQTPLNLTQNNSVSFTIDTAAASKSATRFMIVFNSKAPLYASEIKVKASVKAQAAVIDWIVNAEKDVDHYTVESSRNGKDFSAINNTQANNKANSAYSYTDNQAANGDNYYCIKAISKDGSVQYSDIAKVTIGDRREGISIYPNPVVGKTMNVQLSNLSAGNYEVVLYNANGQQTILQSLQHAGGSITTTLNMPANISPGIYKLVISSYNKLYTSKMIVE